MNRSKDSYHTHIYSFVRDILVVCPACNAEAIVKVKGVLFRNNPEEDVKVVCPACGHNRILKEKPGIAVYNNRTRLVQGRHLFIGGPIDPFFHLPLWLKTDCGNQVLWAYNYEHLDFIRHHVEATLRERNTRNSGNNSLGSRLPRWMTSKKNRDSILQAIRTLKEK